MVEKARVEEMLQEEIAKAKALGLNIGSISSHIEFPKARSFYGMCHHEQNRYEGKSYSYYIRISYFFLEASEADIRETLMHEVLHAEKGSKGHGDKWKESAYKANQAYGYHISRVGTHSGFSVREEAIRQDKAKNPKYDEHKYCVECPKCHHQWYFPTMRKIVREPGIYYCKKCKESLVRVK